MLARTSFSFSFSPSRGPIEIAEPPMRSIRRIILSFFVGEYNFFPIFCSEPVREGKKDEGREKRFGAQSLPSPLLRLTLVHSPSLSCTKLSGRFLDHSPTTTFIVCQDRDSLDLCVTLEAKLSWFARYVVASAWLKIHQAEVGARSSCGRWGHIHRYGVSLGTRKRGTGHINWWFWTLLVLAYPWKKNLSGVLMGLSCRELEPSTSINFISAVK